MYNCKHISHFEYNCPYKPKNHNIPDYINIINTNTINKKKYNNIINTKKSKILQIQKPIQISNKKIIQKQTLNTKIIKPQHELETIISKTEDACLILCINIPANTSATIKIPIVETKIKHPNGYLVIWDDKQKTHNIDTHLYIQQTQDTIYEIKIFGLGIQMFGQTTTKIYDNSLYCDYQKYLIGVKSFGNLGKNFISLEKAFINCKQLVSVPSKLPSNIINTSYMFSGCDKFNFMLNKWKVENIINDVIILIKI